jgi:hypothetical protein
LLLRNLTFTVCSEPLDKSEETKKKTSIRKTKSTKAPASSKKGKSIPSKPAVVNSEDDSIAKLLAAGEQVNSFYFGWVQKVYRISSSKIKNRQVLKFLVLVHLLWAGPVICG